jgi:hypothetical protein
VAGREGSGQGVGQLLHRTPLPVWHFPTLFLSPHVYSPLDTHPPPVQRLCPIYLLTLSLLI